MTTDPRLEHYLASMERVLQPFPVGDRAEILTEIKSHVHATLERDPEARLDSVLTALGEPETVANRYLIERGLKPTKPPFSPIVKWMVIGFLGTFAMLLIFVAVVVSRFTPLLRVDDLKDKVSLFGGMVEVDGKNEKVSIRGSFGDNWEFSGSSIAGAMPMTKGQNLKVKFSSAKLNVTNASDDRLAWKCSYHGDSKVGDPKLENGDLNFDLSNLASARCELFLPENVHLSVRGTNGKMSLDEPRYGVDIDLVNGKVAFDPDSERAYRYSLAVNNGKMDEFISSDKPEALDIKIHLKNGKITRQE